MTRALRVRAVSRAKEIERQIDILGRKRKLERLVVEPGEQNKALGVINDQYPDICTAYTMFAKDVQVKKVLLSRVLTST